MLVFVCVEGGLTKSAWDIQMQVAASKHAADPVDCTFDGQLVLLYRSSVAPTGHYCHHFSSTPEFAAALASIPFVFTWDDHDIFDVRVTGGPAQR
jgi:hypothetical protein